MSGYFHGKPPNAPFKAPGRAPAAPSTERRELSFPNPDPRKRSTWRCKHCQTLNNDAWHTCEECDGDRSIVAEREGDDDDYDNDDGGVPLPQSSNVSSRPPMPFQASASTNLASQSARRPPPPTFQSRRPSALLASASSEHSGSLQATQQGSSLAPLRPINRANSPISSLAQPQPAPPQPPFSPSLGSFKPVRKASTSQAHDAPSKKRGIILSDASDEAAQDVAPLTRKAAKRDQPLNPEASLVLEDKDINQKVQCSSRLPKASELRSPIAAPGEPREQELLDNYDQQTLWRIIREIEDRCMTIKKSGKWDGDQRENLIKRLRDGDQRSREVKANPELMPDYSTMSGKDCDALLRDRYILGPRSLADKRENLRKYDEGYSSILMPIAAVLTGKYSGQTRSQLLAQVRERQSMGEKARKVATNHDLIISLDTQDREGNNTQEFADWTRPQLRAELTRRAIQANANASKPRMLEMIMRDEKRVARFDRAVQLMLLARLGEATTPLHQAAVPYERKEQAEDAGCVFGSNHTWAMPSVHILWEASAFPSVQAMAKEIKPVPPKGLLRIVAYVTALWQRMHHYDGLNDLVKDFYAEIDAREVIETSSRMFVDRTKALLEKSAATWQQVMDAGETIEPWDARQGLYIILNETREFSLENLVYTGSTSANDGFAARVHEQHLNENYRLQHPRTPIYMAMRKAKTYSVKGYFRVPSHWAQTTRGGAYRIKIIESMLMAFFGTYAPSEFPRVQNELQFGLAWPEWKPESKEDMLALVTSRGYRGCNKSIPYNEFASLGVQTAAIWPELLNGVEIPIFGLADDDKPYIQLGFRNVLFPLQGEVAAVVKQNRAKKVQIQVHIADGRHPHEYAGLPTTPRPEYESASSLAISISFPQWGSNPPVALFRWLKWEDNGGSAQVIRKTHLGRAKFCMSIIESCRGQAEIPAGPERFDLDKYGNTADRKVWDIDAADGRQVQSEKFTRGMWALAEDCCSERRFTCPFCQYSISSNRSKTETTMAFIHFNDRVDCKKLAMSQIGLDSEEQKRHLSPCPHCGEEFGSRECLMDHFRSTLGDCRDKQNEILQAKDEPLISPHSVSCEWCGKECVTESNLRLQHWAAVSGQECREMEQAKRERDGRELLPELVWKCYHCNTTFASSAVLHRHWAAAQFEACLTAENNQRITNGEKPFAPRAYFCQEQPCKEATTVPFVRVRVNEINRHYEAYHKGVAVPSKAKLLEIPVHFQGRLDGMILPNGRNAAEVYANTLPTEAELEDVDDDELEDDLETADEPVDDVDG